MSDVQTLKDAYAAFASGDIDTVVAAMDPKIEWEEPDVQGLPGGGIQNGPDEVVKNVFAPIPEHWESFELDPREFVDGGETIVMLGRMKGVGKKTGNKFAVDVAHVWKMRDGKAVRFQQYADTVAQLDALVDEDKQGYPRRG